MLKVTQLKPDEVNLIVYKEICPISQICYQIIKLHNHQKIDTLDIFDGLCDADFKGKNVLFLGLYQNPRLFGRCIMKANKCLLIDNTKDTYDIVSNMSRNALIYCGISLVKI